MNKLVPSALLCKFLDYDYMYAVFSIAPFQYMNGEERKEGSKEVRRRQKEDRQEGKSDYKTENQNI